MNQLAMEEEGAGVGGLAHARAPRLRGLCRMGCETHAPVAPGGGGGGGISGDVSPRCWGRACSVACDIPQIVVCNLRHLASIAYGLAEPHRARRSLLLPVKLPGSVSLGTEPE